MPPSAHVLHNELIVESFLFLICASIGVCEEVYYLYNIFYFIIIFELAFFLVLFFLRILRAV